MSSPLSAPILQPLPRLYAIVDRACFGAGPDVAAPIAAFACKLMAGGVALIQYRNKIGSAPETLSHCRELRRVCYAWPAVRLIVNDRVDLCLAAGFDGVHVGQEDLPPEAVRQVMGNRPWVGISTHCPEQVREADRWPVDYVAIGPVFPTASRANPSPVIGLEGVRSARRLTAKPLVAIGGITRANAASVIEAGADSVAVISDLLRDPRRSAEEFFRVLR